MCGGKLLLVTIHAISCYPTSRSGVCLLISAYTQTQKGRGGMISVRHEGGTLIS